MWSWSRQRFSASAGVAGADGGPEVVEVGVEVVVRDDEDPLGRVRLVVRLELGGRLEPQRGLAAPLLAEDQGRRGVGRAAEELVPGRVVDRRQAAALEDRVGLGVLLAERVAGDPVVPEELFGLHPVAPFLGLIRCSMIPFYPISPTRTIVTTRVRVASSYCDGPSGRGIIVAMTSPLFLGGVPGPGLAIVSGCGDRTEGAGASPLRVAAASDLQKRVPVLVWPSALERNIPIEDDLRCLGSARRADRPGGPVRRLPLGQPGVRAEAGRLRHDPARLGPALRPGRAGDGGPRRVGGGSQDARRPDPARL